MPVTDTRPGKESLTFRAYETKTLQLASGILAVISHLDPRLELAMGMIDRITAGDLGPKGFSDTGKVLERQAKQHSILDQSPALSCVDNDFSEERNSKQL